MAQTNVLHPLFERPAKSPLSIIMFIYCKGIDESSPIHSINGCKLGEWKFTFYVEALNTAGSRQKIKTQPGSITLA